jgi:hypothetical protein
VATLEIGMNPRVASSMQAQSCLIPMGITSVWLNKLNPVYP